MKIYFSKKKKRDGNDAIPFLFHLVFKLDLTGVQGGIYQRPAVDDVVYTAVFYYGC